MLVLPTSCDHRVESLYQILVCTCSCFLVVDLRRNLGGPTLACSGVNEEIPLVAATVAGRAGDSCGSTVKGAGSTVEGAEEAMWGSTVKDEVACLEGQVVGVVAHEVSYLNRIHLRIVAMFLHII